MGAEARYWSVLLEYVILVLRLLESRWPVRDRGKETTVLGYFWRISRAMAETLLPKCMLY